MLSAGPPHSAVLRAAQSPGTLRVCVWPASDVPRHTQSNPDGPAWRALVSDADESSVDGGDAPRMGEVMGTVGCVFPLAMGTAVLANGRLQSAQSCSQPAAMLARRVLTGEL